MQYSQHLMTLFLFATLFMLTGITAPDTAEAQSPEVSEAPYTNPLILHRADPWIYRHTDGYYYFTASVPEFDRLEVRRAKTIEGLKEAEPKVIWRKHDEGPMGSHIWAPELHYIEMVYLFRGRRF